MIIPRNENEPYFYCVKVVTIPKAVPSLGSLITLILRTDDG